MQKLPLFSIVIPLYNKGDTIQRALVSVVNQVFRDFEVIVIDDGSTDDSHDKVIPFQNQLPLKLIRQVNGGVSAARNRGILEAAGAYVALLDADDEWLPNHLQELKIVLDRYPDVPLISTTLVTRTGKDSRWYPWQKKVRSYSLYRLWPMAYPIHTSAMAFRTDCARSVSGFDQKFSMYEDVQFVFKMVEHSKGLIYLNSKNTMRYNNDAGQRLTARRVLPEEMGHFRYAESVAESVDRSSALGRCLRRWICFEFSFRMGSREWMDSFTRAYPKISAWVFDSLPKSVPLKNVYFMYCRMCFRIVYRLRRYVI